MNPTNTNLNDSVSITMMSFEEEDLAYIVDEDEENKCEDEDEESDESDNRGDDRGRDRFESNQEDKENRPSFCTSFNPVNHVLVFENKVKWKQEEYTLPPLKKVPSIEQALFHFNNKSHYQKQHLYQAANEKEKMMITNIYNILEEFIIQNFDAAQSTIHVSNIVQSDDGVYLAVLDNKTLPKFGFTLNFWTRFQYLEHVQFATKIHMKLNGVDETVHQILIQECPTLQYHQDQRDELHKTIFFHLHELIAACVFETCTGTVGELFFSLPSTLVRDILTLPEEVSTKLDQISSKFQDNHSLYEVYTWPTLSSYLESLVKMDPDGFIASKIPSPKSFGFVTNYLNNCCLLPSVKHQYEDAVDCCPRSNQVSILAEQVKNAIHSNLDIVDAIASWTRTYGGSSYVYPPQEMLAKGAMEKIRTYITSPRSPLKIERSTFHALLNHHPSFFYEVFF